MNKQGEARVGALERRNRLNVSFLHGREMLGCDAPRAEATRNGGDNVDCPVGIMIDIRTLAHVQCQVLS
jgi:hypothetical protein